MEFLKKLRKRKREAEEKEQEKQPVFRKNAPWDLEDYELNWLADFTPFNDEFIGDNSRKLPSLQNTVFTSKFVLESSEYVPPLTSLTSACKSIKAPKKGEESEVTDVVFDLKELCGKCGVMSNQQTSFHAAVFRILNLPTILAFHTGNCVNVGAKDNYDTLYASHFFLEVALMAGIKVKLIEVLLRNLVFSIKIGCALDMERLEQDPCIITVFEKRSFSGTICKFYYKDIYLRCLIFGAGKINLMGLPHNISPSEALAYILSVIKPYRLESSDTPSQQRKTTKTLKNNFSEIKNSFSKVTKDKSQLYDLLKRFTKKSLAIAK